MISSRQFYDRVNEAKTSGGIVELSDGMIDLVYGGGPGDFTESFNDSFTDGPIKGPTFIETFHDVYPPGTYGNNFNGR